MKNINYSNIILLFCFLLLFGSCVEYNEMDISDIVEGEPAIIELNLNIETSVVQTRAFSSEKDENKVNNLILFVFDSEGNKSSSHYFGPTDANPDQKVPIDLEIATTSGAKKTIHGIANVGTGMMEADIPKLLSVKTFDELSSIFSSLQQETIERGASFLMSGVVKADPATTTPTLITISSNKDNGNLGTIYLRRLDAKVTFNITTPKGDIILDNNKRISEIEFSENEWTVINSPKRVRIIHDHSKKDPQDTEASSYFNTEPERFERVLDEPFYNKKFSFYILQSRLDYREKIPSTDNDSGDPLSANVQYSLRTKRDKTFDTGSIYPGNKDYYINGDFTYANKYAPYVKFSGTLNYKEAALKVDGVYGEPKLITAKVTYAILLGYAGGDPNDYITECNTHYTYNVTLTSADNIIVEAISSDKDFEPQSGAEGSIAEATKFYEFDAHFDTKIVTFNSSNTLDNLGWYIATPFESNMYNPSDVTPNKPKDYKWIYFRLNEVRDNDYLNTFAKYPGKQKIYEYSRISEIPVGETDRKQYNTDLLNDYLGTDINGEKNSDKLIDIRHLARILSASNATNNNDNGNTPLFKGTKKEIKLTAFIDEYYYDIDPRDDRAYPELWKSFINRQNRALGISRQSDISPDGQSQRAVADIEFSQKAIQSIFNKDRGSDLLTAWGTESIDNTGGLGYETTYSSNNTSELDGHANAVNRWGGIGISLWSDYINSTDNSLVPDKQKVDYACMLLNRDNNGNGKIDTDEVLWYLAAIDQLQDIWIGENSLHLDSHLFRYRKDNTASDYITEQVPLANAPWGEELYISSSRYGGSTTYYSILWSGEGSSVSSSQKNSWMTADRFYYRCLRNLGKGTPNNIATVTQDTDGRAIIHLDNLDKNSIRDYMIPNGSLGVHSERSQHNLPWSSFEVASFSNTASGTWEQVMSGPSKCDLGWRMPNQRELALMATRLHNANGWKSGDHIASTFFSLSKNKSRPGFSVNDTGSSKIKMRLLNDETSFSIRCVRDIK